jgi:NAD-dependent deacetylase
MERLIKKLKNSKYCVVFTGAGVSTLSGIRDFRGENGLYKSVDAEKIFDVSYFRKDPSFYYKHSKELIYSLDDKEPSIVHTELARLEKLGIVKAVITQNIDLLHQKGGSKNVIEVHGSPAVHRCLSCGSRMDYDEVCRIVNNGDTPECSSCGGIIKPDVTFFGEMLPELALENAIDESSRADLMIILGSSLVVQPAASFPLYTLRNRGEIVIVNDMNTPLDSHAFLKYSSLEEVFSYISENI